MTIRVLLLVALAGLLLAACQPQSAPGSAPTEPSPTDAATSAPAETATPDPSATAAITATVPPLREERMLTPPSDLPDPIPTLEEEMPTTGEAPVDLLQQMIDDLSQRLDVAPETITVQRAEEVVWRDGSLGCPQPGMVYTQALVSGFRATLVAGDDTYHYHANDRGYFFLCENPVPPYEGPPSGAADQ